MKKTILLITVLLINIHCFCMNKIDLELFRCIKANDHKGVIRVLSSGGSANSVYKGYTALSYAASLGYDSIVDELIYYGANVNAARKGATALMHAVEQNRVGVIKRLANYGSDAKHRGASGETPLHRAVLKKSADVAGWLIQSGAAVDETDFRGVTPLMLAVFNGDRETAVQLLVNGAEPSRKSLKGHSAFDYAKAGKKPAEMQKLLKSYRAGRYLPGTKAIRVKPGQDLSKILANAKSGSVISLAEGTYESPIYIDKGKELTISGPPGGKAVLTGKGGNCVIAVQDRAVLYLQDVTIQPDGPKAQYGVFIRNATARIIGTGFTNVPKYGIYCEKGSLTVRKSSFNRAGGSSISCFTSKVTVRDSTFSGSKTGIYMQDGSKDDFLIVNGSSFEDMEEGISVLKSNSFTYIQHNDMKAGKNFGFGLYIESDGISVLSSNLLDSAKQGITLRSLGKSTISIVDNRIFNSTSGIQITTDKKADPRVYVCGNTVINTTNAGLYLKNTRYAVVTGNRFLSAKGFAIAYTDVSYGYQHDNLLYSPENAVLFQDSPAGPCNIKNDLILGKIVSGNEQPWINSRSEKYSAAVTPEDKTRIDSLMALLFNATAKVRNAVGVPLKDILDQLKTIRARADSMSSLGVYAQDRVGSIHPVSYRLYPLTGHSLEADLSTAKPAISCDLNRVTCYCRPGKYWLVPDDPNLKVKRLLLKADTYRKIVYDQKYSQFFTIDQKGKISWEPSADKKTFSKKFQYPDRKPAHVLLPLKDPIWLRSTLSRIHSPHFRNCAMPRRFTDEAAITSGRTKARDLFKNLSKRLPGKQSDLFYYMKRKALARVFSAYGDESDVERIFDYCTKTPAKELWGEVIFWTPVIAYIEQRLGIINHGRLLRILNGENRKWAALSACLFHDLGFSQGDTLLKTLPGVADQDNDLLYYTYSSVLDFPDPEILKGLRKALKAFVQDKKNLENDRLIMPRGLLLYMMTYGDKEDWKMISSFKFDPFVTNHLVYLTTDPELLKQFPAYPSSFMPMLSALRDLPRNTSYKAGKAFEKQVLDTAWQSLYTPGDDWMKQRWKSQQARNIQRAYSYLTYYWGAEGKASSFFGYSSSTLPDWASTAHWISHKPDYGLLKKATWDSGFLEAMDYETTQQIQSGLKANSITLEASVMDAVMLSHDMTTQARINESYDDFRDSFMRRAYDFTEWGDKGGAVTGVFAVSMHERDGKITFKCSSDLSTYFYFESSGLINFSRHEGLHTSKIYPYQADKGKLIDRVMFVKEGKISEAVPAGKDSSGSFLYRSGLGKNELSNAYLILRIKCLGRSEDLVYDLFSSPFATRQNRLKRILDRKQETGKN